MPENRKIELYEEGNYIVAEWSPMGPGVPIVGRGMTVLEAIGSLVLYDRLVEVEKSDLVETRFAISYTKCPRQS